MKEENLWGAIELSKWQQTPYIKDMIATEQDVKNGRAVFYVENYGVDHEPLNISIPSVAYQFDEENNSKELAIVIQGERVGENEYVGVRYMEGGNGVCRLSELEFVEYITNESD